MYNLKTQEQGTLIFALRLHHKLIYFPEASHHKNELFFTVINGKRINGKSHKMINAYTVQVLCYILYVKGNVS